MSAHGIEFHHLLTFPLAGGRVERFEKERKDKAFLASRLAAQAAPHVIVCRAVLKGSFPSTILVSDAANLSTAEWMTPLAAGTGAPLLDVAKAVFVGRDEVSGRSIFITAADNVEPTVLKTGAFVSSRTVLQVRDAQAAAVLGLALANFNWVSAVRFCSRCGGPLRVRDHGTHKACTQCKELHFPQVNPAMIVCVLDGKGNVLLSQRKGRGNVAGKRVMRTILSGFVAHGESMEDTVAREVLEEAGADVTWVRYVGTQPWPFPFQLMGGYYALADHSPHLTVDAEELVSVGWVSKEEVRQALAGTNPHFFVPPKGTPPSVLLSAWVEGRVNDRGEEVVAAKL